MSPANLAREAGNRGSRPAEGTGAFGLRDLGLTCEHLGGAEVGFGGVAWLRIGPTMPGLRILGRGQQASQQASQQAPQAQPGEPHALQIGETGQVPELQVENRGVWPLLLPAHLVLSGGWQTRAVERSVVVPAGGGARVPVKCVEAGRWAPRDERTARSFEVADSTGVRTRWSTSRSMADQLTRNGRFAAEQSAVWQQVDEELTRSAIASRTRSYEAYLQGVKRRLVAEAQKAAVRVPQAANGVAIFPRSGGFWIEAYPSTEALAEHADDLLSDLFDDGSAAGSAGGRADSRPAGTAGTAGAGRADIERLIETLWSAPLHRLERLAGTAGDGYAISGGSGGSSGAGSPATPAGADGAERIAGAVLLVDGALAHLAVGAPPTGQGEVSVSGDRRSGQDAGARSPAGEAAGAPQTFASVASGSVGSVSSVGGVASSSPEVTGEQPRVDLETMQRVYARARDLLPEGPPARERVQGYRLVRVLDRNISWVDIRIGGDGYAVLGSHDRCDLVLSSDAGVWLRHLAALCVRLEDDSVGLRLIDLKTDLPFFLDDDTPRWSVLARGSFAMRLGRHVVCGFPIGPAAADGAARADGAAGAVSAQPIGRPVEISGRVRDAGETGVLETGISFGVEARSVPVVAAVPGPSDLSSFVASAPVSQIQDLLGTSASPNHVRVTLERGGMGASVELPSEALEAGVLLGRALNCFDGGLRRIFCEAISRAHVLLVRDRDDVFAFDLCSTNGTRVAGQRIRRYRLSDAGTTLELGKKVVFRWHRRE